MRQRIGMNVCIYFSLKITELVLLHKHNHNFGEQVNGNALPADAYARLEKVVRPELN